MSACDSTQIEPQVARGLNWKRGAIAFLCAVLVVGLGHLYDRRWRLAIAYQLLVPTLVLLARGIVHNVSAGLVILVGAVLLQLFVICQAVWFSLHRPSGFPMPRLSKATWAVAATASILTAAGWGSGFFQNHVVGLKGYKISSDSMAPTMKLGDRVFVDTKAYANSRAQRGDVIAFIEKPNFILAKRIVATAGDKVSFTEAGTILDGKVLKEPYLALHDPDASAQEVFPEHVVARGDVYVLGDNRDHSYDSRYFGDVPNKAVIGKVIGIYWSWNHSRIGTAIR
jgi:signal peptidase I